MHGASRSSLGEDGLGIARAVLVLCAFFAARSAAAGTIWLPDVADGSANVSTTSVAERKFKEIVRQQFDFSCGSAALATLLTYHYNRPTDEMTAFRYMYEKGDQEKIAQAGFSLLDMKGYLASLGARRGRLSVRARNTRECGHPRDRLDELPRLSPLRRRQRRTPRQCSARRPRSRHSARFSRRVRGVVGKQRALHHQERGGRRPQLFQHGNSSGSTSLRRRSGPQ